MCEIVETDHDGYVVYDGFVDDEQVCRELDTLIDRSARRVAGFEKEAIVGTKAFVNEATLPPISELAPNMDAFFASVARPEVQARARALRAMDFPATHRQQA